MNYLPFVTSAVAALVIALLAMPVAMRLAFRLGLVDKPDNTRKLHREPIPLVGGLVTLATTVGVSLGVFGLFGFELVPEDRWQLGALLVAALILVLVGALDDRFNIRGRQKLAGQIVAVTVLIIGGYQFDEVRFAGFRIPFGVFSIVIAYAWCLAAINSMNLLDGADGFASTIGVIVSLSLAVMTMVYGHVADTVVLLALAGSLLGFLRYNFPPARAYLGDAGSMLIGLVIAAIAIRCTFKQAVAYAVFAPVALLAIPLIDTSAAIIRRQFTGRSIFAEDRGHMHHVMARSGLGPVASLVWVAALCSMTAMGAALSIVFAQAEYALASIVMVLVVMIAGRVFGVAEFHLVSRRVRSFLWSILAFRLQPTDAQLLGHTAVQLQGKRDWETIWSQLLQFARESELNHITFDVNAPWMHEAYHAAWQKPGLKGGLSNEWRVEVPMVVDGRVLARVVVRAPRDGRYSHHEIVTNLMKITADLELALSATGSLEGGSSAEPAADRGPERPEAETRGIASPRT